MKDVRINQITYNSVPSIEIPLANGQGNATFYDVEGSTTITENGTYDVTSKAQAVVNVAGSSVTVDPLSVTENGTYTASAGHAYSPVTVNVQGGGGGSDDMNKLIERTLSGSYYNASVTKIGAGAFMRTMVTSAQFPECLEIGSSAFAENTNLSGLEMPKVQAVLLSAFYGCRNLSSIDLPSCKTVDAYAFFSCDRLSHASLQMCSIIGNNAFYYCGLKSIYAPSLTTLGDQALARTKLVEASFPILHIAGNWTFASCYSLETVSLPLLGSVPYSLFYNCSALSEVFLPEVKSVNGWGFFSCRSLKMVSLPNCSVLSRSAFTSCWRLTSLYLMSTSVVSFPDSAVFSSTPIAGFTSYNDGVYGSVFVPASLYDQYISARNWSLFSSRIVSVAEA